MDKAQHLNRAFKVDNQWPYSIYVKKRAIIDTEGTRMALKYFKLFKFGFIIYYYYYYLTHSFII